MNNNRALWDDEPTPAWQRYAQQQGRSAGAQGPARAVSGVGNAVAYGPGLLVSHNLGLMHRQRPFSRDDKHLANAIDHGAREYFNPANFPQRIRSTIASAADPMKLSSAALGLASPVARDAWRGEQEADRVGDLTGGMMGGYGLFKAIPTVATRLRGIGLGAGIGAAPDVIDSVTDETNHINMDPRVMGSTAQNAIFGGMFQPAKKIPRR